MSEAAALAGLFGGTMNSASNKAVAGRLRDARQRAGYGNATAAARAFRWNENTYRSQENATRGLTASNAVTYARAYNVTPGWLLFGEPTIDAAHIEEETIKRCAAFAEGRMAVGGEQILRSLPRLYAKPAEQSKKPEPVNSSLCLGCPPPDYPTDATRCSECPRVSANIARQI